MAGRTQKNSRERLRQGERLGSQTSPRHESHQAGGLHRGWGWVRSKGLLHGEPLLPSSVWTILAVPIRLRPTSFPGESYGIIPSSVSADSFFFSHGLSGTTLLPAAGLESLVSPSRSFPVLPSGWSLLSPHMQPLHSFTWLARLSPHCTPPHMHTCSPLPRTTPEGTL